MFLTGIELARAQDDLFTPAARYCRLPCVFEYNFSHCCRVIYHSQAEFPVVTPPLSPMSSPRILQRWLNGRGPCTLVNHGLSTSRVYTHVGHIFHHTEKPTTSHRAMIFAQICPRLGVVTALITLSSPASFCIRRSRLFFPHVRTLTVGACSRYRIYVQQYMDTLISCTYISMYV